MSPTRTTASRAEHSVGPPSHGDRRRPRRAFVAPYGPIIPARRSRSEVTDRSSPSSSPKERISMPSTVRRRDRHTGCPPLPRLRESPKCLLTARSAATCNRTGLSLAWRSSHQRGRPRLCWKGRVAAAKTIDQRATALPPTRSPRACRSRDRVRREAHALMLARPMPRQHRSDHRWGRRGVLGSPREVSQHAWAWSSACGHPVTGRAGPALAGMTGAGR